MNTGFRALSIAICLLLPLLARADRPYRIVFTYEPKTEGDAYAFAKKIRSTSPYNQMGSDLEIMFVESDPKKMDCHPNRFDSFDCAMGFPLRMGAERGADLVVEVTQQGGRSSAWGNVVRMSTSSGGRAMIHELGHAIGGLADEYPYQKDEAQVACDGPRGSLNSASFRPKLSSYPSDEVAKNLHHVDIPWFYMIEPSTPIISGTELGTPGSAFPFHINRNYGKAGLYPGGNCEKVIPTWHPYQGWNAMNGGSDKYDALEWAAVVRAIEKSRGARLPNLVYSESPGAPAVPVDTTSDSSAGAHPAR